MHALARRACSGTAARAASLAARRHAATAAASPWPAARRAAAATVGAAVAVAGLRATRLVAHAQAAAVPTAIPTLRAAIAPVDPALAGALAALGERARTDVRSHARHEEGSAPALRRPERSVEATLSTGRILELLAGWLRPDAVLLSVVRPREEAAGESRREAHAALAWALVHGTHGVYLTHLPGAFRLRRRP